MNIVMKYIPSCLLLILIFYSCTKNEQPSTKKDKTADLTKEAILSYMSQPDFTCPDFVQQVTGTPVSLQVYDVDASLLYFSVNKLDFKNDETLQRISSDPKSAEFGLEENGRALLGEYTLRGTNRYLFRFPKDDFIVDTNRFVSVKFGEIEYSISVKELADFANNVMIYGGSIDTSSQNKDSTGNIYTANHGAFVSRKNEPSLSRLVKKIIGTETEKRKIAQMLLDFVTRNIKFSNYEAFSGYEVLKRPNEVLMSGASDCSGLTILYTSLLEQADIDYVLLYWKGHIAPAVSGRFDIKNELFIEFEGKKYIPAETTVKGFKIGETILQKDYTTSDVTFIQRPGPNSRMEKLQH